MSDKPAPTPQSRPKKRVITPARREQNKAAQKAWRERRKASQSNLVRGDVRQIAPRPPVEQDEPVAEVQASGSNDGSSTSSHDKTGSAMLADPLMNILRSSRDTIWRAAFTNAISLGFDLMQLADCRNNYISPFFKSITPQDRPQDLVASSLNRSLPLHLQPTMAQILIPHHASLDLIPIPLLRERVIMMSFAHPEEFSLWELKVDIYSRQAVVLKCEGPDGNYQPWDSKRWKMQPWFLKKWKLASREDLPDSIDFTPVEAGR